MNKFDKIEIVPKKNGFLVLFHLNKIMRELSGASVGYSIPFKEVDEYIFTSFKDVLCFLEKLSEDEGKI